MSTWSIYYSIDWYFMNFIAFLGWLFGIRYAIGSMLFEVQTYTNEKGEIAVSPKGTRIFSRIFSGIPLVGLIILFSWLYIPVILNTPKVLAGVSIGIKGEVLTSNRVVIFLFWFIVLLVSLIFEGKNLLFALTKKLKRKKKKDEIFVCGIEYSLLLFAQAFCTSLCLLILVGMLLGTYSNTIQIFWNVLVWMEFILVIVNSIFVHQKIVIFNNGLVIYKKYNKEGYTQKEKIALEFGSGNKVMISIDQKPLFLIECLPIEKENLKKFAQERDILKQIEQQ